MAFKYKIIENPNEEILCSYGCGNVAIYQFKNGKYCCITNPGNCPAVQPPRKKKISKCEHCGTVLDNHKRGRSLCCPECKAKGKNRKKRKPLTDEQKKQRLEKCKKTNMEKYGVPFPIQLQKFKDKREQNNLEKYGVKNPISLQEFQDKKNKTIKEKYGVDNISKLDSIKEKKKKTLMKNHGVESPLQSKEIQQKAKDTTKERYGNEWYSKTAEGRQILRKYHDNVPDVTPLYKITYCRICGQSAFILRGEYNDYAICDDCSDLGLIIHHKMDEDTSKIKTAKTKITSKEKYGTEFACQSNIVRDKIIKSNIERYGVDCVFKSEEIKSKIKNTNLQKYGVENPSQNENVKKKKIETSNVNYGVDYHLQNSESMKKWQDSFAEKHDGARTPYENKEIKDKMIRSIKKSYVKKIKNMIDDMQLEILSDYPLDGGYYKKIKIKCMKCGLLFDESIYHLLATDHKCPECDPVKKSYNNSKPETEITEYLKSIGITHIINNSRSIINPKELDIYLPDYDLAIEYHGLYWHSTNFNKDINPLNHRNKYQLCKDKNIRLLQIFEDEWIFNQKLVKNKIKYILGKSDKLNKIYARKCDIREISAHDKNEFLDKFHIQGGDKSVIKLGAFYNNELVSVMTFSHGNISKGSQKIEGVWELNRFASHSDYIVVGIASKLLKHFERNYTWFEIFSYADLRWSDGNIYAKLGFDYVGDTKQNYFYVKGMERIHRFNLRKQPDEPKEIPEWMLRAEEGYYQIWDAGHMKFEKIHQQE